MTGGSSQKLHFAHILTSSFFLPFFFLPFSCSFIVTSRVWFRHQSLFTSHSPQYLGSVAFCHRSAVFCGNSWTRSNQPLPVTMTQAAESPAKSPTNEWQNRFSMQHFWRRLFLRHGRGRLTNCTVLWGNSFFQRLCTLILAWSSLTLQRALCTFSLPSHSQSRLSLAGAVELFIVYRWFPGVTGSGGGWWL